MFIGPKPTNSTYVTPLPSVATTTASGAATSTPTAQAETVIKDILQKVDLLTMALQVQQKTDFDSRNAVFQEYFKRQPDQATKVPYFATFMEIIPKQDSDRVLAFFKALEAQKK